MVCDAKFPPNVNRPTKSRTSSKLGTEVLEIIIPGPSRFRPGYGFLLAAAALVLFLLSAAGAEEKRVVTLKQLHNSWERLADDSTGTDSSALTAATPDSATAGESGKKLLLLTGDSMIDCLAWTIEPYCARLGYDFKRAPFIASTTGIWAKNRYMARLIKKHRPFFIIICLGSNEYYLDPEAIRNRAGFVKEIIDEAGAIPLLWIGPPDLDAVKALDSVVGGIIGERRYFPSSDLVLDRQGDNHHPSIRAAAAWADTVCRWVQFTSEYKQRLLPPSVQAGSVYARKNYAEIARARMAAVRDSILKARVDSLARAVEIPEERFWQLRTVPYRGQGL